MNIKEKQKIMDSLTDEQRKGIAKIISGKDPDGDYTGRNDNDDSVWEESTSDTLNSLAYYFRTYDPKSVLE